MPKQTFFHLPANKQETIIEAAKEEFSRVPLQDASIANIIKTAGIPRGSFYQYFEDKEDLFYYLLNRIGKRNHDRFVSFLQDHNGDLFEAFTGLFQFMIVHHGNQEHKNFFKNAFLNMNYKLENALANNVYKENQRSLYLDTISHINSDNLNIKDEQELHHVIKIINAITFQNLVQTFVKDLDPKASLENYHIQIELLQRGLRKQED